MMTEVFIIFDKKEFFVPETFIDNILYIEYDAYKIKIYIAKNRG